MAARRRDVAGEGRTAQRPRRFSALKAALLMHIELSQCIECTCTIPRRPCTHASLSSSRYYASEWHYCSYNNCTFAPLCQPWGQHATAELKAWPVVVERWA